MKKIPDIINRLWNVCGQMEIGALLTCGSGINLYNCLNFLKDAYQVYQEISPTL